MSNADPEEVVTSSSDGVTVEKSFEPEDFPVPAIAFVVHSERDESVTVRLVDTVPSHVPPEDIGFHPKYGAEFWGVDGDTIVFEREFEPGEEYTTVYGLRGGDADDVEQFMSEPTIESVDPPLDDVDAGETVRDVIGDEPDAGADAQGGADPDTEAGAEADDDADEPVAGSPGSTDVEVGSADDDDGVPDTSLDLDDAAIESTEPSTASAASAGAPGATARPDTDTGSLVSTLAAEIRSGDVDDAAVDELRDALGVDETRGSEAARVEHLQTRVSDLEAYVDALEEFIDENGDAQQLIADLKADLEATEERFDDLESTAESAAETAESVESDLEGKFEELEARIDRELEDVEARVSEALSELEDVDAAVEAAVEERLEDELEELWEAVDEASTEIEDVADDLSDFREAVDEETGERVDELAEEIEELSEELDDVAEMRDRLANALGGLAPQDAGGEDAADESDDATDATDADESDEADEDDE